MRTTPQIYCLGELHSAGYSDQNIILDTLSKMELCAEKIAEETGVPLENIYDLLNFDPISFQFDSKNDAWLKQTKDFFLNELKHYGDLLKQNYGGKNILSDDYASLGPFEKTTPVPAGGGEPVEQREITPQESYFVKLKRFASENPFLTLLGAAVSTVLFLNFAPAFGVGVSQDGGGQKKDAVIIVGGSEGVMDSGKTPAYTPTEFGKKALTLKVAFGEKRLFEGNDEFTTIGKESFSELDAADRVASWLVTDNMFRQAKRGEHLGTECGLNCLTIPLNGGEPQDPLPFGIHEGYHLWASACKIGNASVPGYIGEVDAVIYEYKIIQKMYNVTGTYTDTYVYELIEGSMKYYDFDSRKPANFNLTSYYNNYMKNVYPNIANDVNACLGINVTQAAEQKWPFQRVIEAKSLGIDVDKIAAENGNLSQAVAEKRKHDLTASTNTTTTLSNTNPAAQAGS